MIEFDGAARADRPGADRRVRGLERRRRRRQRRGRAPRGRLGRRAGGRARPRGLLRLPGQPARRSRWSTAATGGITWPTTRLSRCARRPGADRDVVLVRGIEPNMRWRVVLRRAPRRLPTSSASRLVVTLGALLADTPHTRPVPVSGTATDAELAARARAGAVPLRGPDRHRRRAAGRLRRGRASRPSRSGPPCRTTSRSRRARRRRWRCCAGSRTCSTCASRSATCPRRPRAWERGVDELAAEDERGRRVRPHPGGGRGRPPTCPRPAATRSPRSSSATCAAAPTTGPGPPTRRTRRCSGAQRLDQDQAGYCIGQYPCNSSSGR